MAKTANYAIVINGITESINAVDTLTKKLEELERRIDTLNQKGVNVNAGGSSGGGSKRMSDLTEEQRIVDQINRSHEKRIVLEGELGKKLADEKQAMKELNQEQKSLAAKDRFAAGGYDSKTMLGMKAELADIKAAMQTMQIGSDEMVRAAQRADELNTALLNIEKSYGQYGRNVGNYANSIKEAFEGITVKIGDQEVKFNSVREASKTLQNQMRNMALEGKQDTEEYGNLAKALHEVSEATKRANDDIQAMQQSSVGLHKLMEMFQSFGAIGQITQGFGSMFGGTDFEESMQKLMSLQSVMNGLKTLSEQMNTGSGLGGLFSKGSQEVDKFVAKITGAKVGMNGLTASTKAATTGVKLLSAAFKTLGIGLLIAALTEALDLFKQLGSWLGITASDAADNVNATNEVTNAIERENKELERNILLIKLKESQGLITSEQAKKQSIEETTKAIEQQTKAMLEQIQIEDGREKKNWQNKSGKQDVLEGYGSWEIDPSKIDEATAVWTKFNTAMLQGKDIFDSMGKEWDSWWATAAKTADSQIDLSQKVLANFIVNAAGALENFKNGVDGSKEEVLKLIQAMNDQGIINSIISRLDEFIPSEAVRARIQQIIGSFQSLGGLLGVETVDDQIKKSREAIAKAEAEAKKRASAAAAEARKSAKAVQKAAIDVEKETQKMHLDLMAEGYMKELTRLKYERDELLRRYKGHNDLMLKAEQLYLKKSDKLRRDYNEKAREEYKQLWYNIFAYTTENLREQSEVIGLEIQKIKELTEKGRQPSQYGGNTLFNFFDDSVKADLIQLVDEMASAIQSGVEKGTEFYKLKVEELRQTIGKDYGELGVLNRWLQVKQAFGEDIIPTFEKLADLMYDIQKSTNGDGLLPIMNDGGQSITVLNDDLAVFLNNIEDIKNAYGQLLKRMNESWQGKTFGIPDIWRLYEEQYKKQKELLDRQREDEARANGDWWAEQDHEARETYDKLLQLAEDNAEEIARIEREKEDTLSRIIDEAMDRQTAIYQKYDLKQQELERNKNNERLESFRGYIEAELQETRNLYDRMSKVMEQARTPNDWGIVNLSKIGKAAKDTGMALDAARLELQKLLGNIYSMRDKIPADDYKNLSNEILDMLEEIEKKAKEVAAEPGKSIPEFLSQINQYFSAVSSSFQTILSEFQANQDYIIEKQMDALDKENEALERKLEENEKILERHRNNVDKIENELSEARGDRRERLIDALNAEIIAQRKAQAEKERLEKEQEKIEKQQEELQKKQREYEYQRGLQQILFQTSQAVMSAAVNSWPIPAIPLMALAASTGAIQYAMAKSRKPYAEGGILDGLSHENGGIPVGNTGIEVEGGEFIINRQSTANNAELLNLINNSDRQLSPSDLINFATNMSTSPLEANTVENASLETAFVAYANRPIWVSVQEINTTQENVRRVEVLSGKQ